MDLTTKNSIISELCRISGKSGEALAANRAHLLSLSEAELISLISGERKDLSKGVTLEHSEEVPEYSNVERYSIEINGKVGEAEVTYNDSGYPVEIVERVEGQEVRRVKYKWNSGDKDSPAYVELTEERPDGSVRVTTALDADNEGKIKDTDFVCEQYKDKDENETVTYSIGGVMREEKLKKDGKSVTTLYNGTSYNAYKAGELHRYFQQTEKDGEVYYAEYDGKGNTYTVVQNGESPALIAQKFKVSTSSLMKLNPQKGRKAIDQVGARIRVPGEYNADSGVLKARLSAVANLKKYSEQEFKRTQERIYTSTVEENTLGKDYGGNYWELASDLLGKGASKKEINDKALELEALNMKTNPKLRKGSKILITKASTDSKTVKELTALGFSAGAENNTFYKKYNALSGSEQQNVKSMLRYLKSQKITDKSRIKSEINRVYPNINLFDSDKIILNQGSGMFGTGNKFGRGNGIPLERFVSEYLGLNIHSKEGQEVYRRLNSLSQSELDKISANDYKSQLSSIGKKTQGLADKSLKGVQRSLGKYGVEIRTSDEVRQAQQRYQMSPEYKANRVRQVAAEGAGIAYDRAIELIKAYQDNQGWLNVGYWREKLGCLLDLIVPENDCVAMNFDGVIRRLERERDYVKSALRTSSGSGSEFKRKFKELTGVEFDEGKVKEFLKLASKNSAKSGEAYAAAFGTKVLDSVSGQIQTVSITDGVGDIATMLVGTSWLKELGAMKKMIGGTTKAVGTLVKSGTAAQNISRGLAGAELLGTWTAGSGTVNNITMKRETSLEDWKNLAVNTAISSGFGFVGGISAESLSKIEKAVSDYANKLIGKSSTSASQMNVKAMEQILSSGKGMNGVELWGKFLKATSNTNIAGGAAKFAAEVGIFTGYDIGVEVVKDLVDEEGHLRASLKDPQELEAFLKERLGSQIQNLGLIKTIGHFIEMRLGGKYGSMLSDYEVLKRTNEKELNVNGVKKYVIEVDNGNRIIADSPQKVLQFFQSSLYAEVYAKNMKPSETSSERGGGNTGSKEQAVQLGAAKAEVETEVPTLLATQQPVTPKVSLVTQPPTNVKSVKSTDAVSSQQNNTDINMAEKRAQLKEKLQNSAQIVEAAPEKIQKAAINTPNTTPVEAGDAYPEMEETVAPFSKRLTQTPDIQDLTNSEIKPVILENGEFNNQGEFVSDGTYTKTETGNPMAKQETFKRYSSGDKKLANNFNELKTQVANLFGEKKLATFEEKRLKNFVEKHPELSVKDISEIFADFSHITENTRIDFRYFYKELNQIENLNNLKTNINQFNKFITSMKNQKRDKSDILQYVVTLVLNKNNIQQGIASVEPETFAKNLKYFENIEPTLQSELVYNDIDFLMKPHDQKLIEKINFVNEYNKWASEKAQDGSIILIKKNFNYFQNISDKDFEQFKQNIELIKNLIKNNVTSVDIQYRILGSKDSKYTDLSSKMQEELGENFDYQYLYRFGNDNYNLKPVMKLINAFPETIKNMQAYKVYSLCNKYYSSNDESSKQNFLNTIEIIKKLPQLVSSGSRINLHLLNNFLNNHKMENTDKIIEFLDLAEPQFLAKINLCNPNGNNSSSAIDFDKFFAPEHLNQIIECAKLHKQLPKEFLEYLNSENSNIYVNSKHTFQYEIPPEELHNRIEVINQYKDKFSNKILEDIYSGNMGLNSKTLNLLLSIPSDFAELMASHYPQSFMEKIPQEVIDKFVDYVKKNKEDTSEETFQCFCNNLDNTFFYIFGNLTTEELESLSFQSIADLHEEALSPSAIQNLKNGIAATPKVIRDFIRKDVGFDFYADSDKLIKDSNYPSLIASLSDYTEADLQNIGSKTIVKYLEQGNYSTKSFNKENIEVWKTVPQDIKDKLADKAFNYLTSNSKIDVDMLKTKVESLKGKELFDEMDSESLYSILTNKSSEFDKYLDIIISRPNYNKNDINSTIYNLKKIQEQENPDWDFVSELSNNPNIDPKEIPSLLASIHNNQGSGAQQKDLARSLIANKDVDNANIYFFMLSYKHSNKKSKTNDEKAILAKNLLQRNDIPQVDIPSLMTLIKDENPTIVRKFIEDLIDQKALKVDQITKLFNVFNDKTYSAINEKIQLTRNFLFTKNMELSDVEKILSVLRDITNPKVMNDINILVEQIWNKYPEKNIDDITRFCGVYSVSEQISNIKTELAKELIKNPRIQLRDISLLLSNCRNENSKNYILQSLNEQKLNYSDISKIANAISYNKNIANKQLDLVDYMTEQENYSMTDIPKLLLVFLDNNVISPEILENKIKDFVSAGVDTDLIIDICSNANAISIFNNEVVNILKRLKDNGSDIKGIVQLISTGVIPTELKDRINTLLTLSYFTTEDKIILKKQGVDINNKITILMKMIDSKYPIVETSQENVINFLQHIGNSEKADATIQEADFTQFGKTGIKLQYSRDEFIQNMDKIISEAGYKTQEYSTENIEIPTLKLSEKDKVLTAQKISELSLNHESETVNVILGNKIYEGKRFIGTQGGSNKAYYTQIGDKLYYIKYPTKDKLGQSVEEVIASRLYRAAGIDSPNMEYVYNENGQIIGMAGEYVPQLKNAPYNREQFTDGFAVDAWLANWDAPKNDNTQYREDGVIKVDVGGSLHYRAKGEMKDFTQTVNELSTLIEQNSSFLTMTKEELMNSLQHVINTPDEAIYKIIQESPLDDKRITKILIKRKEYITIFAKQLASLDESQYANIFDLVNAAKIKTAQEFKEDINISELLGYDRTKTGFEGLLNTTGDKEQTLTEEQQELVDKLIAEIKKFTIENRVADNLPISQDLRDFLNSILKGIPEFAAIFEKPQHTTQDYTLDVHILKVLQDSIKDPLYNQLSDTGKIILKFATLLHDISKRYLLEGSDKGHAAKSSEYVYSILDRFNFPQEVKNRIIAIVENHHWFQAYNLKNIGEKEIAALCRNQEDFLIYQIMAKADLKNVNKDFYMEKTHASSFEEAEEKFAEEIARIQPYVDKLAQSQVVITSSKFVQVPERVTPSGRVLPAREFPKEKVNINGVETEIPVLNLSQMDENTNLYQYGFDNITLKDLRLNVHMVANDRIYLDIFKTLAQNPMNNSAQSISLISMDNKSTYCNLKYGLVLDVSNENVSYAYYANTNSGYKKGFDDFVHEMFANNAYRAFVKDNFKSRMTEKGYDLSDKEYAAISKYMSKKQYPEKQIKSLKIGDKIFRKEDLIDAFVYSRDQLIEQNKIKTHGSHNEIVALNSRIVGVIAKENSINDCPGWLLKFAKDNNLPVFLVGQ